MPLTKQEIVNILKKEILALELEPGTIISEATLTKRFKLSRTPIRDVLKQLSLEGYVNIYPQRGSIVSDIDLESVKQIIYLRTTLEKDIIKELCRNISQNNIKTLDEIVSKQNDLLNTNTNSIDFDYFIKLDDTFHKTIFQIAGRLFLWNLIQQFNVHYLRFRRLNMLNKEKLIKIKNEHELIINCLTKNNVNEIDKLVYNHISADINSKNIKNSPHTYKE